MANFVTALDLTVALQLSELSAAAADELAARIQAKHGRRAGIGYSNKSCSTYVDVDDICIRISDHDAMSYNRAGDFAIGLGAGRDDHASINVTAIYEIADYAAVDFDDDGEPTEFEVIGYRETDTPDDDAEFLGYRVDPIAFDAAIAAALAYVDRRLAA
jgi:hypothetical protein